MKRTHQTVAPFHAAALALLLFPATGQSGPPAPDFDRVIAPLLSEHCIACHSGPRPKGRLDLTRKQTALKGGKSGPALVPGKPDQSLLWERVHADEMPPKKPLAQKDKSTLNAWLAAGAPWGTDPIDPFRFSTSKRAGYDWWSLQPVRRSVADAACVGPAPPQVKNVSWPRNPIDRFVLARLEAEGLIPSDEANRRTLIRRLFFDLLGLPPSPHDVDKFITDPNPDAYDHLVDRLLASPHYGERWARHWLDVVRYGESDGFERNGARPNAWHYRDWVIRALDADLPYDKFCRLQIAGDVLRPDDPEALKAVGYLVAGIHNTVLPMNKTAEEIARQDELEDLAGNIGQTFLGMTVNCGRCHDHKFDPVSQRDYYRLVAALAGVRHGEREVLSQAANAELARIRMDLEHLRKQLAAIERPVRQTLVTEKKANALKARPVPAPLASWNFRNGDKHRAAGLKLVGGARLTPAGLVVDGRGAFARTEPFPRELREKTLEAWVRLENLDQRGGGVMSVETADGVVFDAIVYGEKEPGQWMAGSDGFQRTASFQAPIQTDTREDIHLAITYRSDGTITGYRNGRPYGRPYRSKGPVRLPAGTAVVAFGVRHEPAVGNRMLAGTIVQARLYDRPLTADQVAASYNSSDIVTESDVNARLPAEVRRRRNELQAHQTLLKGRTMRIKGRHSKLFTALSQEPPPTRLLVRGQVSEPADTLSAGGVAGVTALRADFGLPPDAPERERRRRLAAWLTHADNPLLARVMVNRLWHHHFGTGIVETPSDFGFNGGRPSHPELLDWLAAEFAARAYSLKAMHRLIVTSNSYRQGSLPHARGLAADADARLLWRKKPLRIEGEVLRDCMLAVSGALNREIGGRGFSDYRQHGDAGTTYYDPIDPVGPAFHRRSVYRFNPRGGNLGLLDAFDCPDPAASAPRRMATTTPQQALALWNGPFAMRMAQQFGERVRTEAGRDVDEQARCAFRLAFQREPLPAEAAAARRLIAEHGLATLCRALFNANEFLIVD